LSDPLTLAKQREEQDRLPFIAVQEFRTEFKEGPNGTQIPFDVVAWVKKGTQNPAVTEEKVSRLEKYPDNPIWQVIAPIYKRWKEGQDAPIDGTPLAAWPGATPQLVKALSSVNVRSVEDLARMEDSAIMKIAWPNLRDKQKQARAYLDAQISTAGVAAENAKLKEEVEFLREEMAALRAALEAEPEEDVQAVTEQPRRRGRPPKIAAVS